MSLTPREEEALRIEARERCLTDLHYLAKYVLGYDRITDHYHKTMAKDIDTPRYRFRLLLHPRSHFKSTLGTESYAIQRLLRNPNERILITNAKLDNSRKFLRTIVQHFNANNKFRWVWRDWWIKEYATEFHKEDMKQRLDWITRNTQDELMLLRPHGIREASITTGAVDASMVSQHFDTILGDDLINRDYVRTQEMVEKSILYFKDLLDLLSPDGTVLLLGTRWSHLDLYSWIIDEFGHKASYSVPKHIIQGQLKEAIESAEKTPEGEKAWLISVTPTSVESPIFPEEFNAEVLQELLDAKGPYEFGAQYLLNPTPAEHQKFLEEWFQKIDVPVDPSTLRVCITVDPAKSLKDGADNTAVAVCGYDDHNRMFLLDGIDEQLTVDELPEYLFSLVVEWQKRASFLLPVGFEAVGFQETYVYTLERMMMERGCFFAIEPIKHRKMSKEERILRLVPRIKNGFFVPRSLIKVPYGGRGTEYDLVQRLKWQLLMFPYAGKDDLADALADQLEIAKAGTLPANKSTPVAHTHNWVHPSVLQDRGVRKHSVANIHTFGAVR